MRKYHIVASFLLLVAALFLQGCPGQAPVVPVTNEVTTEVAAVADVTPQANQADEFAVDIDLGLRQTQKGYGPPDMVTSMKEKVSVLEVKLFYPNGELYKRFSSVVYDGRSHCVCSGVTGGNYQITATLRDGWSTPLFFGAGNIVVNPAMQNSVTIVIRPLSCYLFYFVLPHLPGTYDQVAEIFRHTSITESDGRENQAWWNINERDGVVFTAALPLDFQGGQMVVKDITGRQYTVFVPAIPAMTDWSTFQFGDVFEVDDSAGLDVTVQIESPWDRG